MKISAVLHASLMPFLLLNLGGSLPELNEYDHVGEGGAKDAGNEASLNCEVTPR